MVKFPSSFQPMRSYMLARNLHLGRVPDRGKPDAKVKWHGKYNQLSHIPAEWKAAWLANKYPQFTLSAMQKFEGACKENPHDLFYMDIQLPGQTPLP
eukprot:14478296-Alexandrium_andersonii.AAC.1